MPVPDRGGVVYLRLPDGAWERSPSWEGEDSNPPEVAALAYACTIIEQYEMDARAVQDCMPGYCQGSIYRGAMARIEALRKGAS